MYISLSHLSCIQTVDEPFSLNINRPPLKYHLLDINKNTVSIKAITNHLIVHPYIDCVCRQVLNKHTLVLTEHINIVQ